MSSDTIYKLAAARHTLRSVAATMEHSRPVLQA
jgi:hypothetical protein